MALMLGIGMLGMAGASIAGGLIQSGAQRSIADANARALTESSAAQARALQASAAAQMNAMIVDSGNRKEAAIDHNNVMRTQIQQSTLVAKFQMMSFLAERLDSNSTALKIATQNAKLEMTRNKNEHIENIQGLLNQRHAMDIREREIHDADSRLLA